MTRVLVIRGGAIGDFILTLPIFEAIHVKDPAAEIEVLGYPDIAELAVERRHAIAAKRVDAAEWAPLFAVSGQLAQRERGYLAGFDRIFCVWPDKDGTICRNLLVAGARSVAHVDPMPPAGEVIHAIDHVARQCLRAGLELPYLEPHLYPSERDRWWVERFMRVTRAGERPLLGLEPGSGSARKNWPARNYQELARQWLRRQGHVLLVAGPADDAAVAEMKDGLLGDGIFPLCNESLPRVAAALERCEAFVGNDSGITHMAAAVRTPTLALFGPTDPRVWRPRAPRVRALAPAQGNDLADISVSEVTKQLGELLRPA